MRIEGRCAVITGGASGLGRATAEFLHAAGAQVMLADLDSGGLEEVASSLGARIATHVVDVRHPEQIDAALDHGQRGQAAYAAS